ncbi:putative serine/threonine-protein kinase pim-3 [Triplophysa rosa]|uniref:non-specific serine/threonine protein kinase n=1 Tax=Triplophysa rosa TaxID=992332 RepID=A0A9W7W9C3_TRIRA|nr:putative serine/threonine-protein kinase pim-3 [Triplophysa rosa]
MFPKLLNTVARPKVKYLDYQKGCSSMKQQKYMSISYIDTKHHFYFCSFQDKDPADCLQTPVRSQNDDVIQYRDDVWSDIDDGVDILIFHTSNSRCEEEMEDVENPGVIIEEINCCQYEIGKQLGQGGFGTVYEGTRVRDGLKVAVKIVRKKEHVIKDYMDIPGYPEPIPREVYLQMLACKGEYVPVIVQFLDWQDRLDHYVMVLEDIKMENLLINPCTLDVKLIDFGCGDLLKNSAYTEYMGTRVYTCPEFIKTGKYHGKPATVYSLGVLLFALVCGKFPDRLDRHRINKKIWHKDGLSEECCDLIQACMEKNPEKRIQLEEILYHKWLFSMEMHDDRIFIFG